MARTSNLFAALLLGGALLRAGQPAEPQTAPNPAAATLPAKEDLRWGLTLGLASANTDTTKYYSDKKLGFVIGAQATYDLALDKRLRFRFDFLQLPKATVQSLAGDNVLATTQVSSLALGTDYLYFFSGRPEGFYLLGGMMLGRRQLKHSPGETRTHVSLGIATGLGWQFNRTFGLEARGDWSRWQSNINPGTSHNYGTTSLEASFRF